jgi:alpha-beta hydrolase superfamily lysophospholipase
MPMTKKSYDKLDRPEVLRILFHPRPDSGQEPPAGAFDHDFTVAENVVVGARFYMASLEAPNILFFHGNGEIASDYDQAGPMYNALDISFMVVEYRGYGRSNGEPTVTAMMHDGHVIFKDVRAWLGRENRTGPLLIMGRSLGSACAIDLAAAHQEDITGLIIESGFATTMPLLQAMGIDAAAMGITEQDGFMNAAKIERITKPTFILHARHDQLIPVTNAEILQAQSGARRKEFHMVPGADHNSIMAVTGRLYFEAIRGFINKILGIKPRWRRG